LLALVGGESAALIDDASVGSVLTPRAPRLSPLDRCRASGPRGRVVAGINNPFALRPLEPGEKVLEVGSLADAFVAADQVGPDGHVIAIDMTPEVVTKAQVTALSLGLRNVEFREA
jgi:hypothetical protein